MNADRAATALSARQGGVLRRDQALTCGLTAHQIDQRVKEGRWTSLGRHGYRLLDMPGTLDLVRAAIAALPAAVVSHHAAAELHDIARVPRGIASVSVHTRTTHDFPGVVVHRNQDLARLHITELAGLPVTTVSRTIVDLAGLITHRHLAVVVDEAIAASLASIDDIRVVLDEVAGRGKPGVAALREVIGARSPGPERGSTLERGGARVLVEGGLPEPIYEFSIPWAPERRFDCAYPDDRLAIEWDSKRWHLQLDAFDRDRERDREAVLHGWRVLRFTWNDVEQRPEMVVETVRRALARASTNRGL
ncbi:MAG: hypothetical protein BMS9Abin07_2309 [Acidimicrobiia bacterium]|nr:MAG: hypothetical protein BMS9Abin07_2309 [Acidimicrobiia bacterium]